MTLKERKEFEAAQITKAWRQAWQRVPWLRTAVMTLEQWAWGDASPNEEWEGRWDLLTHGFMVSFDTSRVTDRQYIKLVNWASAIGYPMFAPLLSSSWAEGRGASFSAAWSLTEEGRRRRDYLWQHGRVMACPPLLTHVVKGQVAEAMVAAVTASSKASLAAMGVNIP